MTDTRASGVPTHSALRSPRVPFRLSWQQVLLLVLVLFLYAPVLTGLALNWWHDANYSHGFFVPLLSAYVVWEKRRTLERQKVRPTWWGLPLIIGSILLLLVASLGAELFLARLSFIGMLVGLVVYFLGWRFLRALGFPLGMLLLMIPFPALIYNQIIFPLQLLASRLAAGCLQATQLVPVIREGNVLVLPSGSIEVVEACSGIRSLMSLITLAAAYSYFAEKRNWVRMILVVAMVPMAVVSNAIRVMCSALMTDRWGAQAAEGTIHALSGVVLFLASVCMLLALHGAFRLLCSLPARREAV